MLVINGILYVYIDITEVPLLLLEPYETHCLHFHENNNEGIKFERPLLMGNLFQLQKCEHKASSILLSLCHYS